MKGMIVQPHDKGTFLVSSQTGNGDFYMVDLLDEERPEGRCQCHHFQIRIDAPLRHGEKLEKVTCKHIEIVKKYLIRKLLADMKT